MTIQMPTSPIFSPELDARELYFLRMLVCDAVKNPDFHDIALECVQKLDAAQEKAING